MPNLDKDFYLDKQGLRQLVNELETNIVASEYDTSVSYTVGQYCIYENNFYRCTTATTGTWDSTDWVKVVISDEIPKTVGEVFYGYCDTQPTSGTGYNTWSVTLINGDDFELTEGVTIYVKFEYGEDGTNLLPPVINVNNKGGRPIYYTYANNTGYTPRWMSGQSCILTYDGGRWLLANPQQTAYLTPYHNSTSGLTATNVQSATDEVVSMMVDTSEANALNHLGFYLDENGGLCQVNSI